MERPQQMSGRNLPLHKTAFILPANAQNIKRLRPSGRYYKFCGPLLPLRMMRPDSTGCPGGALLDGLTVVEDWRAVEKQDVLPGKIDPCAEPRRSDVADIDQRDFGISLGQQRRKTARE